MELGHIVLYVSDLDRSVEFGVKVGTDDESLRVLLQRLEARPDLCKVIGAVDGGFVHSLYVTDPPASKSSSTLMFQDGTGMTQTSSSTHHVTN